MKYRLLPLIIVLSLTFMWSCSEFKDDGRISEGIIEYNVTYPKLDPSSILVELLPTTMVMKFKDDKMMTDLSAGFGMFRMNVVADVDDLELSQMVKLINEKYVVNYSEDQAIKSLQASFPEVSIEKTGKEKVIAGYNCKEALVKVMGDSVETYSIFYTEEINIEKPNWFTQYTDIEGVLMEYQVERYNLCSRFTAVNVKTDPIEDDVFDIPNEYKEINESEMSAKMEEIFNSFSE